MRWIKRVIAQASLALIGLLMAACAPISTPTPAVAPTPAESISAAEDAEVGLLPSAPAPSRLIYSPWSTDFTRRTVEWNEISSGGPTKDGIPAIDTPSFESVGDAAQWLSERDPVILFEQKGEIRAYPLAILIWHEIVNDVVGDKPVAVTFCPLCNASIVFDATLQGQALDFGTTGLLRNSDLIMYDRQSETWWQQFTGQGIVGEWAGEQLDFLPSQVISFGDFAAEFPDAQVLARPASARSYGANPYTGYDSTQGQPFLFSGAVDSRLSSTQRVMGLSVDGVIRAYPFDAIAAAGAVNDTIGGVPIVVMHKAGTASALDTRAIAEGRDVGSAAVFDRRLDARTLTFSANDDGTFTDAETGSTWSILGEGVAGGYDGERLTQILAFDHFWFAWAAFHPETEVWQADQ